MQIRVYTFMFYKSTLYVKRSKIVYTNFDFKITYS